MPTDLSVFEIVEVGGIEGNLVASAVACSPSIPYSTSATNLQTALTETAQFILALAGQPKFQGGLDFNDPIPVAPAQGYVTGDYWIFRDGGDRTVDPIDPSIEAGDWAIYTRDSVWTILNYSFLNVIAKNVPYTPAVGNLTNVAAALDNLALADAAQDVAGNLRLRYREFNSINDVATQMGVAINLSGSTVGENIRILSNAMPSRSMVTLTVGSSTSEEYKLCEIDFSTFTLWTLGPTRNFAVVYSKEGGGQYVASFDAGVTKEVEFRETANYTRAGTWLESQNFEKQLTIGENWSGAAVAALIVENQNAGQAVPIISALSANGTERWLVDNGGHTTQTGAADIGGSLTVTGQTSLNGLANTKSIQMDGSLTFLDQGNTINGLYLMKAEYFQNQEYCEFGRAYNSGSKSTLEINNANAQGKFIDCIDSEGSNLFFVKRASNSGQMQVTGPSAQIYSQGTITSGGDMTCLGDMNVSTGTLTVNGVAISDQTFVKYGNSNPPSNYVTIERTGNHSGVLYLKGNVATGSTPWLSCSTAEQPDISVKIFTNGTIETTGEVNCENLAAETSVISYPLGNNTTGTLQLKTNEQTYNDLWLDCSVPGENASIKLRSSGWGSFSGGTDQTISYSSTATIGQRNDGTTHNSATVPSLTLKNLNTAYGARTLACIDDLGNDTFQVLSRGEVKIEGARAELTVVGDIHNSGYKIDTSNLNAGIVSANSSTIYTSTTTDNHAVGGTLTVAGTVVTNSTLTVGSVDIGAKITEYQTKITDLETRLAALEASAVTYSS